VAFKFFLTWQLLVVVRIRWRGVRIKCADFVDIIREERGLHTIHGQGGTSHSSLVSIFGKTKSSQRGKVKAIAIQLEKKGRKGAAKKPILYHKFCFFKLK
jgi:hypothetical protein